MSQAKRRIGEKVLLATIAAFGLAVWLALFWIAVEIDIGMNFFR